MAAEDKDGNRRKGRKNERGTSDSGGQSTAEHGDNNLAGIHQRQIQGGAEWGIVGLIGILSRADGWLRIVPGSDLKLVYVKWKYTLGRHSGSYVMAVSSLWRLDEAIGALTRKLEEVDAGTRKPTPDRYYGGDHGPSAADELAHAWGPDRG